MIHSKQIIDAVKQQGLLPLFYHEDPSCCINVVQALYDAGIRVVEFTNRGANALDNFKQLLVTRQQRWPEMLLAIGTIKNAREADAYLDAGADFIICPGTIEEVAMQVQERGYLWVPGAATPTEIIQAESWGASLVKLFPGNLLGPSFVSAVKELFPNISFMPTGGVEKEAENLQAWFKAGVAAVGVGSKLITKELLANRDFARIKDDTTQMMKTIQSIQKI